MTIKTRYALNDICGHAVLICESREDALALADATIGSSRNIENFVSEVLYLPDMRAGDDDDDEDEDTIHVVLLHHAHNDDEGGDSDD